HSRKSTLTDTMEALGSRYLFHFWRRHTATEENTDGGLLRVEDHLECADLIDGFLTALHLNQQSARFTAGTVVEPHLTINAAVRTFFAIIPQLASELVNNPLLESVRVAFRQYFGTRKIGRYAFNLYGHRLVKFAC